MENGRNFHIHGLPESFSKFRERIDPEANLSSAQFWLTFYKELTAIAEADSVDEDQAFQSFVNMLNGAGNAIEHLERRVIALEAAASTPQPDQD